MPSYADTFLQIDCTEFSLCYERKKSKTYSIYMTTCEIACTETTQQSLYVNMQLGLKSPVI